MYTFINIYKERDIIEFLLESGFVAQLGRALAF